MSKVDSFHTLLVEELRDIYDAEKRLTKAIPKLVKAATNTDLESALEGHLAETEEQVSRLEQAFKALNAPARAKTCAGMKGLIEEGDEHLKEDYSDDGLRDATIIGAAQRVEHYEIAAYGTAIAHARRLGLDAVVRLLEQSLAEEKAANEKLTEIAEASVNAEAAEGDADAEPAMTERPRKPATAGGNGRKESGQQSQRTLSAAGRRR